MGYGDYKGALRDDHRDPFPHSLLLGGSGDLVSR